MTRSITLDLNDSNELLKEANDQLSLKHIFKVFISFTIRFMIVWIGFCLLSTVFNLFINNIPSYNEIITMSIISLITPCILSSILTFFYFVTLWLDQIDAKRLTKEKGLTRILNQVYIDKNDDNKIYLLHEIIDKCDNEFINDKQSLYVEIPNNYSGFSYSKYSKYMHGTIASIIDKRIITLNDVIELRKSILQKYGTNDDQNLSLKEKERRINEFKQKNLW